MVALRDRHAPDEFGRLSLFSYLRLTAVPLRVQNWSGSRSRGGLNESYKRSYVRKLVPLGLGVPAKKAVLPFLRPGAARPDPFTSVALASHLSCWCFRLLKELPKKNHSRTPRARNSHPCVSFFFGFGPQ